MQILQVRVGRLDTALRCPFRTALRTTSTIPGVVLRVETSDGVGWGSAAATPAITGDTEAAILSDLAEAAYRLRGAHWEHPNELLDQLDLATGSARAAVDIALHDVWAQSAQEPLWRLLGASRPSLETDLTISIDQPQTMAGKAADAVARGFGILKVKLGDPELDPARLAAVRAAAPQARLRVDANQAWTADQAVRLVTGFEEAGLGVELVEQPVARHDLNGLRAVTAAVSTPVLADEAVFTADDARRVIEMQAADLINVKLMKAGGLSGALAVTGLAAEAGVDCMVGAMMEPTIGIAAAAALACGQQCVTMADLDPPLLAASEPVTGALTVDGPRLSLSDRPGLGVQQVAGVAWLD